MAALSGAAEKLRPILQKRPNPRTTTDPEAYGLWQKELVDAMGKVDLDNITAWLEFSGVDLESLGAKPIEIADFSEENPVDPTIASLVSQWVGADSSAKAGHKFNLQRHHKSHHT